MKVVIVRNPVNGHEIAVSAMSASDVSNLIASLGLTRSGNRRTDKDGRQRYANADRSVYVDVVVPASVEDMMGMVG